MSGPRINGDSRTSKPVRKHEVIGVSTEGETTARQTEVIKVLLLTAVHLTAEQLNDFKVQEIMGTVEHKPDK